MSASACPRPAQPAHRRRRPRARTSANPAGTPRARRVEQPAPSASRGALLRTGSPTRLLRWRRVHESRLAKYDHARMGVVVLSGVGPRRRIRNSGWDYVVASQSAKPSQYAGSRVPDRALSPAIMSGAPACCPRSEVPLRAVSIVRGRRDYSLADRGSDLQQFAGTRARARAFQSAIIARVRTGLDRSEVPFRSGLRLPVCRRICAVRSVTGPPTVRMTCSAVRDLPDRDSERSSFWWYRTCWF